MSRGDGAVDAPQRRETCCSILPLWVREGMHFDNASFMHPIMLGIVSTIAIIGTIAQLIGLNFWLSIDKKSPFTTAAVVAIFWDIILLYIFAVHMIRKRAELQRFAFLKDRYVMLQLFVIGSLEAAGTLAVSYSALGTSEALQSLLKATVVPITAVFTVFVLKFDPGVSSKWDQFRSLLRCESVAAVVLIIGAVAMLGFGGETTSQHHHQAVANASFINSSSSSSINGTSSSSVMHKPDNRSWIWMVCLLGAAFNALHFVLQGNFMEVHTLEHDIFSHDNDDSSHHIAADTKHLNRAFIGGPIESLPIIDDEDISGPIGGASSAHLTSTTPYVETNQQSRMSVDVVGAADFAVTRALHTPRHGDDVAEAADIYKHDKGHQSIAARLLRSPYAIRSDDFTVKISMLFVDTFFQIIFTFMCLPFDAVHGFGPHETVASSWNAFSTGFQGIFHDSPDGTSRYFVIFLCGFCSSHLAFAYLNHYSPTYTPMVMILASPITNIMLLIIPSWNSHPASPVVWASVISAILMAVAAGLFGRFEIMRKKKRIAEMQKF